MEITMESIIEKLGFDPRTYKPVVPEDPWLIDDATPNPFSVLTYEESAFLHDELIEKK